MRRQACQWGWRWIPPVEVQTLPGGCEIHPLTWVCDMAPENHRREWTRGLQKRQPPTHPLPSLCWRRQLCRAQTSMPTWWDAFDCKTGLPVPVRSEGQPGDQHNHTELNIATGACKKYDRVKVDCIKVYATQGPYELQPTKYKLLVVKKRLTEMNVKSVRGMEWRCKIEGLDNFMTHLLIFLKINI